jgi:hypothetical protein
MVTLHPTIEGSRAKRLEPMQPCVSKAGYLVVSGVQILGAATSIATVLIQCSCLLVATPLACEWLIMVVVAWRQRVQYG